MQATVIRLINEIKDTSLPENRRSTAVEHLRVHLIRNAGDVERNMQNQVAHSNGVEVLISLSCAPHEMRTRSSALACLTELAFDNMQIALKLGKSDQLLDCCYSILSSPDPYLWMDAADVLGNTAGFSWEVHPNTLCCLDPIIALLQSPNTPHEAIEQCTRYLVAHAYNPTSRQRLREAGAAEALIKHSKSLGLYSMSGLMGLACLVGDDESHPALQAPAMCRDLVAALSATLQGSDYPPGSRLFFTDWRLMLGISNLCGSAANRPMLLECGLMPVLGEILATRRDQRLIEATLTTLWKLGVAAK
eukprot:c53209_g1_i1.p1 GENE.c53209_g1_i1~~c53209_g1_i1.p1  ORF type:complete len:305 (-),score=59.36 c53209_g1_i1:121-1035(-)